MGDTAVIDIDIGGKQVRVAVDARVAFVEAEVVKLSRIEFDLLALMASEPSRCFRPEDMVRLIPSWHGYNRVTCSRTVESHASKVRRKLLAAGVVAVDNVWGVGYRLLPAALIQGGSDVATHAAS